MPTLTSIIEGCGKLDIKCWVREASRSAVESATKPLNDIIDKAKKTIDEAKDTLKKATSIIDKATDFLKNIPDLIKSSIEKTMVNPIKIFFVGLFQKPLNDILGFVNTIEDFFNTLPKRFSDVEHGIDGMGKALKHEFTNLGIGVETGFKDIFNFVGLFKYVFTYINDFFNTYIGSRINCGLQKISNMRYCFIYYFMDLVGYTLYSILIKFPVLLIKLITGFDIQSGIDNMWNLIYELDDFLHGMTGYHIVQYSEHTMNKCYKCNNLQEMPNFPTQVFTDQISKINKDFNVDIPHLLNEPIQEFIDAGTYMKAAFH